MPNRILVTIWGDNNNQEGDYLIVKSKGDGGLVYVTGEVKVKPNDGSGDNPVGNAIVFTSNSPFVAQSGSVTGLNAADRKS